ncbi:52 kDa repressor of the inhibitor of the protein kinase [Acromyrmex echinatior]|uniref:52 kDa repressor of the inhibitor of the protein kinase n=1 Tax=Acromyrmex echinatior TaxID=103372 RepID=F4WE41_ACREC|nr:52 kDa repressor of the inhibitor of the protein kinase [Acromyrmex echinatior]
MIKGKNVWCAVPACTKKFNLEKRYFFRFPKEHERWLQWVRACGRLDLEPKGPEYAYQNCRLCHLHFKEKWYKINKMRARLHPDAIPTIFFGPECGNNMESTETQQEHLEKHMEIKTEVETNDNMEFAETLPIIVDNMDTEIIKPNTSKHTKQDMKSSEDSPRKNKLRVKLAKLKAQNKTLREIIRRLHLKAKKKNIRD